MDASEARALTRSILNDWRAEGVDLTKPRRFINSFRVYSPVALERFLRRLDAAAYNVVARGDRVEGEAYCVRVETASTIEPTTGALDALTDDAARLAEEEGVEYDLWYSVGLRPPGLKPRPVESTADVHVSRATG